MAPWFWVFDRLGAARLGGAAALVGHADVPRRRSGPAGCSASSGVGRAGALAGALVYVFTPYQLAFTARISVLLLPWAALPWLVGLTDAGDPAAGWRGPGRAGPGAPLGRRDQRVVAAAGRRRRRCCGWSCEAARRAGPSGAARGRAGRPLVAAGVSLWWLVGAPPPGALRAAGAPAHREPPDGRRAILARRRAARPGQLVLLRARPRGVLHRPGRGLRQRPARGGADLRRPGRRARRRVARALGPPQPTSACSWWWAPSSRWGRGPSTTRARTARRGRRSPPTRRLGMAFRNSPRAVPLVVLGFAAMLAAAVAAIPRRTWSRVGVGTVVVLALGALLPGLAGRVPVRRTRPARGGARVLAGRRRGSRCRRSRHADPRAARFDLRGLPLGEPGRSAHPGAHRPALPGTGGAARTERRRR